MRNAGFLIVLVLSLLTACGKKNKPPRHILKQEKMEAVLWDIMRADQFLFTYVLSKDSTKSKQTESQKLYTQIFQLHHIDEKQFRESFAWYKAHPELLTVVMDSISVHGSRTAETAPVPVTVPVPDTSSKTIIPATKPAADTVRRKIPIKVLKAD